MMSYDSGSQNAAVRRGASGLALAIAMVSAIPALAQTAPGQTAPPPEEEEIVVRGFRASLDSALSLKRNETAAVDSIVAEDIGKFPDSNLAESMQRVPGVALSRGDGGEGRNISVRGLGAAFTRVRINGMEGSAQTGSSDIYGAGNSGRSFDFNVFPTEIFSALAVRKTTSADVEEGSLGATVDLSAPKPLDLKKDFTLTATLRGVYNELSKKVDPRGSLLVGKKFADGRFGVLASFAYQKRHIREVGYSAVDILSADANGFDPDGVAGPAPVQPFCTPIGYAPISPNVAGKGATATMCSTGNPRTGTLAAYNTVANLRRADLPNVPGSGAFLPRLPRYVNSEQDTERMGGTLSLQFRPDDDTDIGVDAIYSRFEVTRRDNYIAGISFGRSINNNGQPMVSVRDAQFSSSGSLLYGLFDGVDVRSEGLVDHWTSDFLQVNTHLRHRFNDKLQIEMLVGKNQSVWWNPKRFQTFMDAIDTPNFSIDFRNGRSTPLLGFGFDVSNPASFNYAPARSDGTVLGGFSFQGKPSKNQTDNFTGELNLDYSLSDALKLRVGGQYRSSDFSAWTSLPYTSQTIVQALPAGTTLASITRQISGLDQLFGSGAPKSWSAIDPDKWAQAFNYDAVQFCRTECGAVASRIRESVKSAYAMATFDTDMALPFKVRGDVGVRYVKTDMLAAGTVSVAAAGQTPTNLRGQYGQVLRDYDDWLPSANVVIEPARNVLLRLAAAKVMSRPELGQLAPTSGITATTRNGNINNPYLDPIRADTFDAALEWYFQPGSLLSVAYFHKNIKSYVQRVTSQIPFTQLGLPVALLDNTNTLPTEIFTVGQPLNTPGGKLNGVEVNAQVQMRFLPGFLKNIGVLGNYTHVTSKIRYILASVNGVPTVTTTADLVGLSKNTASGTIFYEDSKFSIRATASYRDRYIRAIPASPGSDLQGNSPNTFVDASASFNVNEHIKLIVEAQNLTDERNNLYIDSVRRDTLFQTRIGRTFNFGVNFQF
ncbi:TonB-dependent receptor [Sphingomonas pituitosa]|uniref:TonB-dependent receptor n=1 Tax=Sphingomonas pituitosa TaxID=99597 RepID=UPI00083293D8|nr:TonB-dependent receptor [Sphingomonas pituitosa]